MPQLITCPDCAATLRVSDEMLGKQVRCPGCQTVLITEKPSAPRKPRSEPLADAVEEEVQVRSKPRKKKAVVDDEGPPKSLIWAILAGSVAIVLVFVGIILFVVFGTNLLTPKPKPTPTAATTAPPTETPATPSSGSAPVAPSTGLPPADAWVRKLIPGTRLSVEIPAHAGSGDNPLAEVLAGLGGGTEGSLSGSEKSLAGPRQFIAMLQPSNDLLGEVDYIATMEAAAQMDMNIKIIAKYALEGRPVIVLKQKTAGLPVMDLYCKDGSKTIRLMVLGLGVNEEMPSVRRFFNSLRVEK